MLLSDHQHPEEKPLLPRSSARTPGSGLVAVASTHVAVLVAALVFLLRHLASLAPPAPETLAAGSRLDALALGAVRLALGSVVWVSSLRILLDREPLVLHIPDRWRYNGSPLVE